MLKPAILCAALLLSFSSHAVPLSAAQVLNQFNEVVLTDARSSSQTDGRAYVGNTVNGGGYGQNMNGAAASNYAGLTAMGSVARVNVQAGVVVGGAMSDSTVNSGTTVVKGSAARDMLNGAAYIAGAEAGNTYNGGKVASMTAGMQRNADAALSTNFGTVLNDLSDSLKTLSSTGSTVKYLNNVAIFNAVVNADGLAVFDLTGIDDVLFGMSQFSFNLNGAKTVVLNTDIQSANIAATFLGNDARQYASQLLWNFYDAKSLNIERQWGGALLATDAALTNKNEMLGGVYVNSIDQQGKLSGAGFSGVLPSGGNESLAGRPSGQAPEPGSIALFAAGLALMGALARRRRSARQQAG